MVCMQKLMGTTVNSLFQREKFFSGNRINFIGVLKIEYKFPSKTVLDFFSVEFWAVLSERAYIIKKLMEP